MVARRVGEDFHRFHVNASGCQFPRFKNRFTLAWLAEIISSCNRFSIPTAPALASTKNYRHATDYQIEFQLRFPSPVHRHKTLF